MTAQNTMTESLRDLLRNGAGDPPKPGPILDRSSSVTIVNDLTTVSLSLKGYGVSHGTVANIPSDILQPGGATTIRVEDNAGVYGSEGWITYIIGGDGAEVMTKFGCPCNQLMYKCKVTATPSDHATIKDYTKTGPLSVEVRIH